jgi:hypothetical protein
MDISRLRLINDLGWMIASELYQMALIYCLQTGGPGTNIHNFRNRSDSVAYIRSLGFTLVEWYQLGMRLGPASWMVSDGPHFLDLTDELVDMFKIHSSYGSVIARLWPNHRHLTNSRNPPLYWEHGYRRSERIRIWTELN